MFERMIVQQTRKINRKKPRFVRLSSNLPSAMAAVGTALCFLLWMGPFCQTSSAQETKKSTKSREKLRDSRKRFTPLGRFEDKRITESSGVAVAGVGQEGKNPGAVWTFNDSGGSAMLFRVGFKGQTQATLAFKNKTNRDWETMCQFMLDGKSYLVVGDVGDNLRRRKSCQIHIVAEPDVKAKFDADGKLVVQDLKSEVQTYGFTYEDGPHNCEAMAYDVETHRFWFVEKVYVDDRRKEAPGIYTLQDPRTVSPSTPNAIPKHVAKRVADFPVRNVTGMAFSPDNQRLVIRDYFGAWLFERAKGKTWLETIKETKPNTLPLPLQSQGEAICFTADSQSLLVTSEFAKSILWKVQISDESVKASGKKKATGKEKK